MNTNYKAIALKIKMTTLLLSLFAVLICTAQVQQNGTLYIGDSGVVSVHSGIFSFGTTSAATQTTKTASTFGRLFFVGATTYGNATNAHHINGYAATTGKTAFVFPVGSGAVLAPLQITAAAAAATYNAAYYPNNPTTIGATFDAVTLRALATTEYWDVQSTSNAKVTLTWRSSSSLTALASNMTIDNLTIAGWNGTQWVIIASNFDTNYLGTGAASTPTAGSITSIDNVNFAAFSKFAIAQKTICEPLIASNGVMKTWNGSWTPTGAPTLANPVTISTAYSGSFACNSLVLNADITLAANESVEIVNGVTGSAKIIMASSASVVQRASGATAPNVEITKISTGLRRLDYVYFGSPIVGNFFTDFATATAAGGTAGAFDLFYRYNSGAGGGWQTTTTTTPGQGLIARVKQAAPFINATLTANVIVVLDGVANNGDVSITTSNDPADPDGGRSHVLLGNPYPSAINGDKFLQENTGIDGVIYIWRAANNTTSAGTGLYTQADYAAYTRAGAVSPSAITGTFDGSIPSAQGFLVKILPTGSAIASPAITFTNCMRVTGNNTVFYRQATQSTADNPKDRFKINMTGANGVFSQILVAYMPEATLGYDRMYDAGRNSVSTAQFYSIFEGDGRRLAINARPTFTNTDVVPLGIAKNNTTPETFHFSLTDKEGVFNTANETVYLHDKIANTYHNLSATDFSYATAETTVNNRFEIVYQNSMLSNPDFNTTGAIALIKNQFFSVTVNENITGIQLYDIAGRLIMDYKNIKESAFNSPFNHAAGIYIAKIRLDSGKTVTQKLINN